MMKYLLPLIICLGLLSCSDQARQEIENSASAFDLAQAMASVKQSNISMTKAFKILDTASIIQSFTEKAELFPAHHETIEGRDSIRVYLIKLLQGNAKELKIESNNLWGDSVLLTEVGTYKIKGSDNKKLDQGKYIVLWKQESGNWKIYRAMWNTDLSESKIKFQDTTAQSDKSLLSKLIGK